MIEALGIGHLFALSRTEAIAGFFTPLAVFAVFLAAQLVLPARRAPGYVIDPETGEPRPYRLNGLPVFALALAVWASGIAGLPLDWFYRSAVPAVIGGTVFSAVFAVLAVRGRPKSGSLAADLWHGRALELALFGGRLDVKMYLYVVGGTMFALNALSGAAYHYERFGADSNPGVFLYAALFTFYVLDYFVFERVQLYTYDLIHEKLGFKLLWGGLIVYGWLFALPLWGMAALPGPGFAPGWTNAWLIGTAALFLCGWSVSRGASLQKYTFKRWPDRRFLGLVEPVYIEAGGRRILCSGFWGAARHFNYLGEGALALSIALVFGYPGNPWAWTYFVFIVSLMLWRERADDRYCAEKYGPEKWAEYRARVKYRIFPGVY